MDTPSSDDRPDLQQTLQYLFEGQRVNQDLINHLGQAMTTMMNAQPAGPTPAARPTGGGPKVKEPRSYDGDRSNNKLEDHVRDLTNWVNFYDRRGYWQSEQEKIEQSATYLTGRMHRMYDLQSNSLSTFAAYVQWLHTTFKDNNEQHRLRDDWNACIQSGKSVMEYASEILYLRARITPFKSDAEVREHMRSGLDRPIQMKLLEHPDADNLSLDEFVARADRYEQIEAAKAFIQRGSDNRSSSRGQVYAIAGAPRRGGRRPSSLTRRPRKGTQEWQDWCKEHSACFGCGNMAHRSRDCPEKIGTARSPTRGRPQSPYPRARSSSRGRSPSPGSVTGPPFSPKNVSFSQGKDQA